MCTTTRYGWCALLHLLGRSRGVDFPWSCGGLGQRFSSSTVTLSSGTSHSPCSGSTFTVGHQPNFSHGINEQLGRIELTGDTKFTGSIIKRVLVMPVVPSFSHRTPTDNGVLGRIRKNIIRMVTVQVSRGVDQPCKVQDDDISQSSCHKEGIPKFFPPCIRGNLSRHHKAHVQGEPRIGFLLKHDQRIFLQITKVQFTSSLHNILVLLHKQPSHVCVKETTCGIVWIGIRLGMFVMHTMITCPMENRSLIRNGITKH
mmetsp:Transcript_11242/g.14850  ORF Transcript_11242/g.14850 Transcript_11242/m.14850 type:complete len:257 (-) Transcript_11242:70-840(-)